MKSLPKEIFKIEQGKQYHTVNVGLSGAEVREYDSFVLKIQPRTAQSQNEAAFMRFLDGRALAPKLLAYASQDGLDYIAMSKLTGKMLCDAQYLQNPRRLLEYAAQGLAALRSIPASECPCDMSLSVKLRIAERNVAENKVDTANVNRSTFGKNGRFLNPEKLLEWLCDNKPSEDLAVCHGDYCLPNIFVCGARTGMIDFPYAGTADGYCDIALLYRSVNSNLNGEYGGEKYPPLDEKMFFDILGVAPDIDKIEYYTLLDELF